MADTPPPDNGKSALENKLESMEAVYRRFGRDGMKDYPIGDVTLFLASKQLALRDSPKGYEIGEPQKAANRKLELEIRDLSNYMDAFAAGAGLTVVQRFVRGQSSPKAGPPAGKPKDRNFDVEK